MPLSVVLCLGFFLLIVTGNLGPTLGRFGVSRGAAAAGSLLLAALYAIRLPLSGGAVYVLLNPGTLLLTAFAALCSDSAEDLLMSFFLALTLGVVSFFLLRNGTESEWRFALIGMAAALLLRMFLKNPVNAAAVLALTAPVLGLAFGVEHYALFGSVRLSFASAGHNLLTLSGIAALGVFYAVPLPRLLRRKPAGFPEPDGR